MNTRQGFGFRRKASKVTLEEVTCATGCSRKAPLAVLSGTGGLVGQELGGGADTSGSRRRAILETEAQRESQFY